LQKNYTNKLLTRARVDAYDSLDANSAYVFHPTAVKTEGSRGKEVIG
jgi:hypothetical protein